jgi:DNA-binding CsgD family transcriptional regulator
MTSEKPTIRLETEKQLRIFSLPLRQKILRTMRMIGKPVTSKDIADRLKIAPSSARHHLNRLKEIGLVEHHHYKTINGIKADFLIASDVNVSIGTDISDAHTAERETASQVMLAEISNRFMGTLSARREKASNTPQRFFGDLMGGIAHLSTQDAEKLYHMVRDFLDAHTLPKTSDETPWEYAFLLYEAEQ